MPTNSLRVVAVVIGVLAIARGLWTVYQEGWSVGGKYIAFAITSFIVSAARGPRGLAVAAAVLLIVSWAFRKPAT